MDGSDGPCGVTNITSRLRVTSAEIVAIVNPLSGAGASSGVAERRVSLLTDQFAAAGVAGTVHLTERRHHARELASAAVERGASTVIAWGGDGTINEVGVALAGSNVALGIIPAGSGNGFARELGIPWAPEAAIAIALRGTARPIDAGEIDGRLFFNIAGVGVDAVIAEQFNTRTVGQRGMGPYVRFAMRELFRYQAARYRVVLDGEAIVSDALLIAFANGREYGNGIRLAPRARMDDGKLEALVVEDRHPLSRIWCGRHLVLGTADRAPRVVARSIQEATIETEGEMLYHVDGEIGRARDRLAVRIRPALLTVRVP
jgi:diacylglycerol kinase (ATP)